MGSEKNVYFKFNSSKVIVPEQLIKTSAYLAKYH